MRFEATKFAVLFGRRNSHVVRLVREYTMRAKHEGVTLTLADVTGFRNWVYSVLRSDPGAVADMRSLGTLVQPASSTLLRVDMRSTAAANGRKVYAFYHDGTTGEQTLTAGSYAAGLTRTYGAGAKRLVAYLGRHRVGRVQSLYTDGRTAFGGRIEWLLTTACKWAVIDGTNTLSGTLQAWPQADASYVYCIGGAHTGRTLSGWFNSCATLPAKGADLSASEGGYFAGYQSLATNGIPDRGLVDAGPAGLVLQVQWKTSNTTTTGIGDGIVNGAGVFTGVLAGDPTLSQHPAFAAVGGLRTSAHGGKTDWFLPSREQLDILLWAFKPSTQNNNAASQFAADSACPKRAAIRTTTYPAQTPLTQWRTGSALALAEEIFTCRQLTDINVVQQNSADLTQNSIAKTTLRRVRAVRTYTVS